MHDQNKSRATAIQDIERQGISVCLIFRNEEQNILRCLSSITSPVSNWELILINNASTDRSLDLITTYSKAHPELTIRVLYSHENNLAQSRRRCVAEAKFGMIAFIDADCEAPAEWLTTLSTSLQLGRLLNSILAGVGGGQVPSAKRCSFNYALELFVNNRFVTTRSSQLRSASNFSSAFHIATCNAIFEKSALISSDSFDQKFGRVCEDVDMGWRLYKSGYFLEKIREPTVIHHHRPSCRAWVLKIFRYSKGHVQLLFVHRRHYTPQLLTPLALGLTLLLTIALSRQVFVILLSLYVAGAACLSIFHLPPQTPIKIRMYFFQIVIGSHSAAILGQMMGLLCESMEFSIRLCARR